MKDCLKQSIPFSTRNPKGIFDSSGDDVQQMAWARS